MTAKGETVNQTGLARVFGVHRNTIAAWVRNGCPAIETGGKKTGRDWKFDTAAVAQWREEIATQNAIGDTDHATRDELERRKLAAETTLQELKAAQARGDLGAIAEFEKQTENLLVEIRQRLLQIPARVATVTLAADTEGAVKEILEDEITQALTALANEHSDE